MRVGQRTRGGATRDTNVVNRERLELVQCSASLVGKRDCAEREGSGVQPASTRSVK